MARLRREHHRMLGNGWCTRPPELDCACVMKRAAVRRGHRRILRVLTPAGRAIPARYNGPRSTEGLIDLADVIGAMSTGC